MYLNTNKQGYHESPAHEVGLADAVVHGAVLTEADEQGVDGHLGNTGTIN